MHSKEILSEVTYRTRANNNRGFGGKNTGFLPNFTTKNKIKAHSPYENKQGAVIIHERLLLARVRYISKSASEL